MYALNTTNMVWLHKQTIDIFENEIYTKNIFWAVSISLVLFFLLSLRFIQMGGVKK